jgi:LuxR family maltose regulon positive regulatory protein
MVQDERSPAETGQAVHPGAAGVVCRSGLFERLRASERVTVVSAPPGSGKTILLRSWIRDEGHRDRAAWVAVERFERDPQRFWVSVLDALRRTTPGSALVQPLTAAPDLDGWVIVERLLKDLARLEDRIWLVIDDVHELRSPDTQRQLELLLMRVSPELRFVLITRHDVRLGLHRLRLEGELTEIRPADLRFSLAEARELLTAAGAELTDSALMLLHERTEGWAAGLRLAALSLAGHLDPERFAAEFSGSERTVAEYLVAEVLERQSEEGRRLLLRTSVLDRVCGELADALTESPGGQRILQELEEANAFVVSLDAARSWFRYHRLFADLLQLELRRTAPGEIPGLHKAAARWFARRGFAADAIRHAQAAQDWEMGSRMLADLWPSLYLSGQTATTHELLAGFPAEVRAADAELAALDAADQLAQGSLEAAERYVKLADRGSASVPADRRGQLRLLLRVVGLLLARQHGDPSAVADEARRLLAGADAPDAVPPGLGEELRGLALISAGIAEVWVGRFEDAEQHLERGVALARQTGRPYLEFSGLAHQAVVEIYRSQRRAAERSEQAIELARQHGWTDDPATGVAYALLGSALALQGRPDDAESAILRAEHAIRAAADPAAAMMVYYIRGQLELTRGRDAEALTVFQAAERLAGQLAISHYLVPATRAFHLLALVRLGETERAEQILTGLSEQERDSGEMHIAATALRLAQDDPLAATVAIAPVLDASASLRRKTWLVQAFMLEAAAREALGDPGAADRAVERALDLAEPDGALSFLLLHPAPDLIERHAHQPTAHASLIAEILGLMSGRKRVLPGGWSQPPLDPLSETEIRVLRYLPTNLSTSEIATELYVSPNTVKTHVHHVYAKLGTHRRAEAVERARALGLLAPSPHRRLMPTAAAPGQIAARGPCVCGRADLPLAPVGWFCR